MSELSSKQLEAVAGIAKGLSPSAIGKAIGTSERTIQRWIKLPKFQEALSQLYAKTQSKIIEKTSEESAEKFSVDLRKLQEEHLKSYAKMRRIAEIGLEHYQKKMEASPEDCNIRNLSIFSQILDRCLRGEAQSAFLKHLDINTAIGVVSSAGYVIYDETSQPGEKIEAIYN